MGGKAANPESEWDDAWRAEGEAVGSASGAVGRNGHTGVGRNRRHQSLDVEDIQFGKVTVQHDEGFDSLRHCGLARLVESRVESHPPLDQESRAGRLDKLAEIRGWRDDDDVWHGLSGDPQHAPQEMRRQLAALVRREHG